MNKITIIHLSDLHYDNSKPNDTEIVLKALLRDLDHFPVIDFILFSGDLVNAGDKKDDFEKAFQTFIKPLLKKTNLNEDRFFIVPGNHDIQRESIDEILEEGLKVLLKDRDRLNSILDREIKNNFQHIERLDHFNDFKTRFNLKNTISSNKLFSTHKIDKENICIGIACLNSGWRASGKGSGHDKGKLLLGERQIDTALNDLKECYIKIALQHHPLDWLNEYDQGNAEERLSREFDIVFCGHLHNSNSRLIQHFENKTILVQSGCLYEDRSHYNGYSVVCFDANNGKGTIYFRSYFDGRRVFDKAIDKCPGGKVAIQIRGKAVKTPFDKDMLPILESIGRVSEIVDELVKFILKQIPLLDGYKLFPSSKRKDEGESHSINYLRQAVIELFNLEKSESEHSSLEQKKVGKYITNYLILHLSLSVFKEYSATSKDAVRSVLRILERAREESPGNPEIEYFLARFFYIGDFYKEAREAISRFYRINKDDESPLIPQIDEIQKVIDRRGNPGENPNPAPMSTGNTRTRRRNLYFWGKKVGGKL
jgi:predicted MPP superfamily phosphohydrolase